MIGASRQSTLHNSQWRQSTLWWQSTLGFQRKKRGRSWRRRQCNNLWEPLGDADRLIYRRSPLGPVTEILMLLLFFRTYLDLPRGL
jgi:hypothetical protein